MSERKFSEVFWMIYDAASTHPRYISNRGGTRSGKTYSTLQFLNQLIPVTDKAGEVTSVVSETFPHLKRGAIRDFEDIMGHALKDDSNWNATDCVYTYPNGAKLEFFSADSPDKVLGPARKRLFVNEANHIPYDTFRQLAVRTRGIIFIDYNPASVFWAMDKVETRDNCVLLITTYLNNKEFLSPEQVAEIESNKGDNLWWKVYGLGEVGTLEGVVYDFTQIDELPDTDGMLETYGLDFGFTNSITAVTHCFIHRGRKEIYLDERLYRRGLQNSEIAAFLKEEGIKPGVVVYADAAEPKSIDEISQYGIRIEKCDKTSQADRHNPITAQITLLKSYKLFVTKRSLNLINELRNYVWDTNKTGEKLNVPVKINDHLCDSFRYGCYTPLSKAAGQYTIGFNRYRTNNGNKLHH